MNNVLSLIKSIQEFTGESPCKKAIQKIVYLIQEANEDLGFDYSIHFYGPYSADLDSEIRYLCSRGELNINVNTMGYGHMISVDDSVEISSANPAVQNVVAIFGEKSPSDLELLTTTLYVQRESSDTGVKGIVNGVVKIKGAKYSEDRIKQAIKELEDKKYFVLNEEAGVVS